ncbi:hypothetical protein FSP39_023798 [Pinctada imbricata]|uniref:Tyrosine-protein phosphatase non-receptor type 13 n=1 Tax=Pinctada imbricata TaxID=66713 RepID=A0AA89BS09_PINIB|nr:hypothetical protein FSP39_023798 [Pinctada imbricata]
MEVRSLRVLAKGFYMPGLHMRYGSETALKLRLESDLESLASSEMSMDRYSKRAGDVIHTPSSQPHVPLSERLKKAKNLISNSNNPTKEYYGPEFVHKSMKPILRVPVPLQGESLKNPSLARRVVVVLLTGQKLEAFVDPSTTGHQMFESIITHVELPEFFFFGLSYISHGEHFFLEPDLKLHKISPEGWRDGTKSGVAVTFTLYLRVKFYPEDLSLVRHQVTIHQLYLQLRQDIVDERLWCHEERCVALAGLALQAEYGNYDSEMMGEYYFQTDHYFPTNLINDFGAENLYTKAMGSHIQASQMTERHAQLDFVKMAINLPDYGIHYYKLLKSKQDTSSAVWLGIKLKCMVIAESHTLHRVITQQYPWQAVQKVSFNKRRFSISVKPELAAGQPKKMNYFTNSFRKGSYLLQFLTAQHRFQLSMRARETQLGMEDLSADRFDILSSEHSGSCTFQVVLEKERDGGIGITIVGGDSDYGIFIKDVRPHGPADVEGTLRKGDKILAIDNVSMNKMDHAAAVQMIQNSPHQVKLLVSRVNLASSSNQTLDVADFPRDLDESDADNDHVHTHGYVYTQSLQSHGQNNVVKEEFTKTKNIPEQHAAYYQSEQSVDHVRAIPYMREMTESTINAEKGNFAMIVVFSSTGLRPVELMRYPVVWRPSVRLSVRKQFLPLYEVTLQKKDGTFGLNIAGGVNTSVRQGGIYVKSLQRGGAAELDGTIQIGDRILKINGHLLNQCTHKQAVEAIRGAPASCCFIMERCPTRSRESSTGTSPQQEFVSGEISPQPFTQQHKVTEGNVHVEKSAGVSQEMRHSYPGMPPIGRQGHDLSEAVIGEEDMENNDGKIYYPFVNKENTYSVDIRKGSSGLGFSVYGGVDVDTDEPTQGIVRIKQVFPIGPAASSGQIERDDVILEVNGKPVKGLTHAETMGTLRTTPADVNLLMCRPDPEELSPLFKHLQPSFSATTTPTVGIEVSSQSETESEDEPILYRDTLPEGGMLITPPSGFSSPPTHYLGGYHFSPSVPPTSTPPPLPTSLPPVSPAFSVQSDSVVPGQQKNHMGRWGSFENLRNAITPRSNMEDDFNSTYDASTDNEGELLHDAHNDMQHLTIGERLTRLSRSDSSGSLSDNSRSSTSSVVRSPLKVTAERDDFSSQMTSMSSDVFYQRPVTNTANQGIGTQGTENDEEGLSEDDAPPIDMIDPPAPSVSPVYLQQYHFGADPVDDLIDVNPDSVFVNEIDGNQQQLGETSEIQSKAEVERKAESQEVSQELSLSDKYEEKADGEIQYAQELDHDISLPNENVSLIISHGDNSQYTAKTNKPLEQAASCENYEDIRHETDVTNSEWDYNSMKDLLVQGQNYIQSDKKGIESESRYVDSEDDKKDIESKSRYVDSEDNQTDSECDNESRRDKDDLIDLQSHEHCDYKDTRSESRYSDTENEHLELENEQNMSEQDKIVNQHSQVLYDSQGHRSDGDHTDSDETNSVNRDFDEECVKDEVIIRKTEPNDAELFVSKSSLSEFIHDDNFLEEVEGEENVNVREVSPVRDFDDNVILRSDANLTEDSFNRSHSFGAKDKENKVFTIELKKFKSHGLGFSLVTAEKDNQTGVFVRSIAENGEADRDGRLRVMDRVLKVNEESLVGLTHPKAVQMIRKSKGKVSLTISRMSSRNLDVITPPVIMTDSEDDSYDVDHSSVSGDDYYDEEEEEEHFYGDRISFGERDLGPEENKNEDIDEEEDEDVNESIIDSEEEENINAFVREAEKLLASSEPSDFHSDSFIEGGGSGNTTFIEAGNWSHNFEVAYTEDRESEENDAWSFTDEYDRDRHAVEIPQEELGRDQMSVKNQTFTIVPSQRTLNIDIPVMLNTEWLEALPFLLPGEEMMSELPGLLSRLQQQTQRDDPAEEYKELRNIKSTDECSIAKKPENKPCNRFRNVLPYDVNRVELGRNADYINASHILMNVGGCEAHFIATQGPKLETAEDFWQMIWEQKVSVIAMLTLDVESQKVKCHRYWPDFQEIPIYVCDETLRIKLISVESVTDMDVRKISLEDVTNNECRIVYHVNFTTWPDQGVPKPITVLQCIQLVHVYHSTGPIVVHCSAGIGRTGTFITIDLALAQIETNGKCDIFEIVQELRKQRYGMIQTKVNI